MNTSNKIPLQRSVAGMFDHVEELVIALLLGLMTLVTFLNVILRYVFNSSIIWGLEFVLVLFAWLVLFGIPYGFKKASHLGVDAFINLFGDKAKRRFALVSCFICVIYALLLLKGAWDYWAPFAGLSTLRSDFNFSEGLFVDTRDRAFYTTEQIPMPGFLRFLEDLINQGEEYENLPRVIPYAILPFAMLMMLFRIVQISFRIYVGTQPTLIASHEAEEAAATASQKINEG